MSNSSFLTELFEPDSWPASGEACCWLTFRFIRLTLHPLWFIPWFPILHAYVVSIILFSLRICYSVTSWGKITVILETAYFIIMEFDLSGLIIVLLTRSYTLPVRHLLGLDCERFSSKKWHILFCFILFKQDDQHEHTFSNYVRIRDVVQKTCLRRWTIGKSGERGSGISVLPARHDDDDDDIFSTNLRFSALIYN